MGHDHHHGIPEVPDYRQYNVEDVPVLMDIKRRLAILGLHDPWLRNEVWRYQMPGDYPVGSIRKLTPLFRGFRYGIVIALVATAISKTFSRKVKH